MNGHMKLTGQQQYQVKLALDRTMLAWIRTTLAMASFGFALVAFFRALRYLVKDPHAARLHVGAIRYGEALLVLGVTSMALAAASYIRGLRMLRRGDTPALRPWSLSIILGVALALLALTGIWILFSTEFPQHP
jgi:putative membrane protein